jgi:glycosyltransferase involved in cell wall biosynthesis
MTQPRITVVVPSFNQGRYLEAALQSIFSQDLPLEVFVLDGGSIDNSAEIIERWRPQLAWARSAPDGGQSAAINEGAALGSAPYVCWLNSDDLLLEDSLKILLQTLEAHPLAPAAYGRVWNLDDTSQRRTPVWVQPFSERALARRCIISQPGTLIRRSAWEAVGGIDETLDMAMDYDLWWKLYKRFGSFAFVEDFVAVNRNHDATKTRNFRVSHYREAIDVVRRHHGSVPLKWWLYQPYAVWWKALRR